jgi:hypothetical protein
MQNCPRCATKNDDDALFCTNCGVSLKTGATSPFEHQVKDFAKDMEQLGRKAGDRMVKTAQRIRDNTSDAGKHVEQRIDRASKHTENWYDRTFGILGPLISSFVFLIVIRLVIEFLRISKDNVVVFSIIGPMLYTYLLLLFGVTLLSSYTQYFSRKSHQFRIFSPLIYAIVPIVWLWVAMQILNSLSGPLDLPDLKTAALSIEQNLPTIFIFVLLLGYVILALTMSQEQKRKLQQD